MNSSVSSTASVICGVPQGSILGPLLFLVFINDLPANLPLSNTILFADDTNLIFNNHNPIQLMNEVTETTHNLMNWLTDNKLSLNVSKTHYLNFNLKKKLINFNPIINSCPIKELKVTKFLGIWIDSNLSWEEHINKLTQKLAQICYAFRVLKEIICIQVLRTIYFGYVQSLLNYGIPFWGSSIFLPKLFKMQKKIIRIITNSNNRAPSKPIFEKLEILPLPCIYILETVSLINKNQDMFIKNCDLHSHNTRSQNAFHVSQHRVNKTIKGIDHQGILMYNKLPACIKNIKSSFKFKCAVKKLLLCKLFYSVDDFLMHTNLNV
jgi:hypothetical protein